ADFVRRVRAMEIEQVTLGIIAAQISRRTTFSGTTTCYVAWRANLAGRLYLLSAVDEVLRVLDALQTGELTACGWTKGEPALSAA
ncbi:MAG: hypothetical protein WCE62_21965, partial [Polyangiales bacterium]